MISYRDDPEYTRQSLRLQWLEMESAKTSNALDKINLEYVRDRIPASALVRAELVERRSGYRLEAKELEISLSHIKEGLRTGYVQNKYDTLVTLLNNLSLGHLVVEASNLRRLKELA